jgi:MFS superfamily sulfate permease-like transporter
MNVSVLRRYAQVRRSAFVLSVVATVGVVLFGVLEGIVLAIVLSILLFFRRNWWPHGAVLGHVDTLDGWYSVDRYADSREVPGVVVYRWEAPLFFANAGVFRETVRELVRDRNPHFVVLQCEAITDIDVTAADMLKRLDLELNDRGVHLAFVELRDRLRDLVERYGLDETLDRDHFYRSINLALDDIARLDAQPDTPQP